jgi:hypothetical protein
MMTPQKRITFDQSNNQTNNEISVAVAVFAHSGSQKKSKTARVVSGKTPRKGFLLGSVDTTLTPPPLVPVITHDPETQSPGKCFLLFPSVSHKHASPRTTADATI